MSEIRKANTLILIRKKTKIKLVKLAKLDERTMIGELAHVIDKHHKKVIEKQEV